LKFAGSLSDKHFVSKAGKHYFTQWDHDKKPRDVVLRKLERIQGLAKQKTKKAEQENDCHVIKATKEISMQHLILLAVVSMMVLYVLIIVGCLCYVGRHGRWTS